MAAQQIPNLLSLRGTPRSRARRGRGRGSLGPAGNDDSQTSSRERNDLDIQSTDTDAAVSRFSAVSLGYLDDPFAFCFVNGPVRRRLPIINRGTYTRTTALDNLIDKFLEPNPNTCHINKQIISLGAGTDTRYFRLRAQEKHRNVVYHEFDFPSVSTAKWRTVSSNENLSKNEQNGTLFQSSGDNSEISFSREAEWGFVRTSGSTSETIYCCHPVDLRQLPYSSSRPIHSFRGIREDLPTLLISECCLCYLEVDTARDVVKWFADKIPSLGVILYEPIGADDSFGQMMVANLAARNIAMPTVKFYKTLADQRARLSQMGFGGAGNEGGIEGETIERIWEDWVMATEKDRVDGLEGLDEVEEWQMLARHYAVIWGWKGSVGWEGWSGFRQSK